MSEDLYFGVYRGLVVDNKDPQGHRRVTVKVPQLTGDFVSDWAWPQENGFAKVQVPDIGEGVWVMFEGGNSSYPIWTGTFGKPTKDKRVNTKVLRDTTSLSGIENTHIITERTANGTTEVDLVATLLVMAAKIKSLETRVTTLEGQMATKANVSHSHA
jgi:phage baseplate assembly protein gpV